MIKYVTVLHRKEGVGREEFSSYWENTHAPILKEIPGLRGYVQNHALPDPEGNEPPYDGFGELYFDSLWTPCKRGSRVRKVRRRLPTSPTSATPKDSCLSSSTR